MGNIVTFTDIGYLQQIPDRVDDKSKTNVVAAPTTADAPAAATTEAAATAAADAAATAATEPVEEDKTGGNGDNGEKGGAAGGSDVDISNLSPREQYANFKAEVGILSEVPFETYVEKHKEMDAQAHSMRCRRFGMSFSEAQKRQRRVFFGTILMDEPWEVLEILAAEYYGLLHTMVFVEPTRDVYGKPRTPLRLQATQVLKSMFGVENIRIVKFDVDDEKVKGDLLLDTARNRIVKEWIDMGMTGEDLALMSGVDEVFARDYITAIIYCESPEFKIDVHKCRYNRVKSFGHNQVYEASPECVSRTKVYDHPEVMIGACMEGIGSETENRLAPRDETGVNRAKGWNCEDRSEEEKIKDQTYPLWSGADLRSLCGGKQIRFQANMHQRYSAFHFRNFFNTARDMRLKFTTEDKLYEKSMDDLGEDMRVTYRCLKDIDDEQDAVTKREPGGFKVLKPMTPLYLADENYRKKAHERAVKKILEDEKKVKGGSGGKKTAEKKA